MSNEIKDTIQKARADARNRIFNSFSNSDEIEKADEDELMKGHNVGDMHPNGKWVWKETKPGHFDWRNAGSEKKDEKRAFDMLADSERRKNSIADRKGELSDAPVGSKVSGGGYEPWTKIGKNSWKNSHTGALANDISVHERIGSFKDFKIVEAAPKTTDDDKKPEKKELSHMDQIKNIIKNSSDPEKAFEAAKAIKGVPSSEAKAFADKYNPDGKSTMYGAFVKMYDEVKGTKTVVGKPTTSEDVARKVIADKFLDTIQLVDNTIQLKDIQVQKTTKGNWFVYHKGKKITTVAGSMLDDATVKKYGLERNSKAEDEKAATVKPDGKKPSKTEIDIWHEKNIEDAKAKLNKLGFNDNSPKFRECEKSLLKLKGFKEKLDIDSSLKDIRKNFEYEISRDGDTVIGIYLNNNDIRNAEDWAADYAEEKKNHPRSYDINRFQAQKAAEKINKVMGTKFSSSSYSKTGNWTGFQTF